MTGQKMSCRLLPSMAFPCATSQGGGPSTQEALGPLWFASVCFGVGRSEREQVEFQESPQPDRVEQADNDCKVVRAASAMVRLRCIRCPP